jgi:hypothetical protein
LKDLKGEKELWMENQMEICGIFDDFCRELKNVGQNLNQAKVV